MVTGYNLELRKYSGHEETENIQIIKKLRNYSGHEETWKISTCIKKIMLTR